MAPWAGTSPPLVGAQMGTGRPPVPPKVKRQGLVAHSFLPFLALAGFTGDRSLQFLRIGQNKEGIDVTS
jgi:hypothetical protein